MLLRHILQDDAYNLKLLGKFSKLRVDALKLRPQKKKSAAKINVNNIHNIYISILLTLNVQCKSYMHGVQTDYSMLLTIQI